MDKKPTITRAIAPNQPVEEPQNTDYETVNADAEVGQSMRNNTEEQAFTPKKADTSKADEPTDT